MPTSVTDDDLKYLGSTPNAKVPGTSLDVMYLTKNISMSPNPTPEKANTLCWFPDTTDFGSDSSWEASTPHSKPWIGKLSSFQRFNSSSLDYKDLDESMFNFQSDVSRKILSTPDPVVSRSALRRFGAIGLKSRVSNDFQFHHGFSASDDESVIECHDGEVQFELEYSNVSDIPQEMSQKFSSFVSSIRLEYDQSSVFDSRTEFEVEKTPKMTSYLKKHEFNSILNARTPHPKRTMKRRMTSKSVPSYNKMLDLSSSSPGSVQRMTSSTDSRDVNNSDGSSTKGNSRFHSSKNFRNRALSDFSHRGSEANSDYYASYLDYADFLRTAIMSPINDCAFEGSNEDDGSGHLLTIPEMEADGLFCDSPMKMSIDAPESSPEFKQKTVPVVAHKNFEAKTSKFRSSSKLFAAVMFSEIEKIRQITIDEGLVPLLLGNIPFVHRPMSFRVESPTEEEKLSLAKLTSTVGCKVLHKLLVPATLQAILKNDLFRAMGNGNSRALTSNKFLPSVVKKQTPSHGLQRRRYGPREVHRNIWRLEKKSVVKPAKSIKDTETVDTFAKCSCVVM